MGVKLWILNVCNVSCLVIVASQLSVFHFWQSIIKFRSKSINQKMWVKKYLSKNVGQKMSSNKCESKMSVKNVSQKCRSKNVGQISLLQRDHSGAELKTKRSISFLVAELREKFQSHSKSQNGISSRPKIFVNPIFVKSLYVL